MVMTLAERFAVTSSRRIEANIAIASLTSPILITIEGKRDFSEPVALFYRGGTGTDSAEYWLPRNMFRNLRRERHGSIDSRRPQRLADD